MLFFFLKALFWALNFSKFIHTFQWASEFFFNFRFFSRKSQSQQKLAKNIIHFTIQVCSKHLTHLMNFTPLEFTLHQFLTTLNCVLDSSCWSSLKKNVCIFLKIFLRLFLFQRHHKILPDGVRGANRQNNFFKLKVVCHLEMIYNFSFGLKFL